MSEIRKRLPDFKPSLTEETRQVPKKKPSTSTSITSQASRKANISAESANKKTYKYDILIDNAYRDRDLALKIHEYLTGKGFKVWIDKFDLHGDWTVEIPKAMKDSEIIILCTSEAYEKSQNCQKSAEYVGTLQNTIIPVIAQQRYRLQGWLAILLGNRMYIDVAHNFDEGCKQLLVEINHFLYDSK
jgi:hypothetical protein